MTKSKSVFNRFLKAFLAGGLASISALISAGVSFSNTNELKNFIVVLIGAFFSGGIMALEKYLSWTTEPKA